MEKFFNNDWNLMIFGGKLVYKEIQVVVYNRMFLMFLLEFYFLKRFLIIIIFKQ